MKRNKLITFTLLCCMSLFCLQGVSAQGTLGEYPGAGVGFDSGCGYPDAGNSDPGVSDVSLAGNACGSPFDVSFGTWAEFGGGFDITGFNLNNYDIDQEAAYGIRLFYGPQNNCCTICLDAMLDLGQGAACGTFGPQADLGSFGIPVPANYGLDVFGAEVIPYADMCPNTEYFAQYQFILATAVDLTDPDGNFCAMDDALITNAGTQTTVQTLVAPGTRDPIVINSTTLTAAAAADCGATDVLVDFTADITAGCTVSFGTCSQGLEIEFRASLSCGDGSTLDINTGPLFNDPTACFTGAVFNGQISLGSAADVCAIFACDPNASLELYATYTFCEADDINGDGSGNDEAIMSMSVADILAAYDAASCCMVAPVDCASTYNFTGPTEVCSGAPIDFLVDPGCDVSLNLIDFGAGAGVFPNIIFDLYVYAPGGVPGQVACDGYTVIPADIDGGMSGNPDIIYLGSPDNAPGGGPFGIEGCGDLDGLASIVNAGCDPLTVTFFVVPYSFDVDSDGDGTYGGYLADSNTEACPIICQDVIINPIFEVITDESDGCNQIAGVFVSDGAGGFFDQDGDGALTFADACATDILGPDCTDGGTLDYDYSALDVGSCSGDLTGTLTCVCPADGCASTYSFTGPTEVCSAEPIDFLVDAGCDVSLNTVDFGTGTGVFPSIIFDLYVYAPGGVAGQVACDGYTVIPADIDGGMSGNPDIIYLGSPDNAPGGGPFGIEGCGDLDDLISIVNPGCDPLTVTFFVVPYSFDYDTDGDNVYGAYLADSNPEACPIICQDVTINPVFEAVEDAADGCDPIVGLYVTDGAGGIIDQDGDGAITISDACVTAQLDPTADCTDGATLDYDFSANDVGGCSTGLTGTLTCDCESDECTVPNQPVFVPSGRQSGSGILNNKNKKN